MTDQQPNKETIAMLNDRLKKVQDGKTMAFDEMIAKRKEQLTGNLIPTIMCSIPEQPPKLEKYTQKEIEENSEGYFSNCTFVCPDEVADELRPLRIKLVQCLDDMDDGRWITAMHKVDELIESFNKLDKKLRGNK